MFNKDFYPTPKPLLQKMTKGIEFRAIRTVLEPSAGKGDMAEYINNKFRNTRYRGYGQDNETMYDIDCIEIDPNLQHILKGKNFRLVHDDFLTFDTYKKYDLIIANFPFSEADKHLLKAIEIQQKSGGQIVCLINAETLKNPYSNIRKDLVRKLDKLNAQVEYLHDEFIDAERKTQVEIALIKIDIPKPDSKTSIILDKLKQDEKFHQQHTAQQNDIVDGDYIIGAIQRYNHEIRTGVHLIGEYEKLKPFMQSEFDKEGSQVLKLSIGSDRSYSQQSYSFLINEYVKEIRYKYWKILFNSNEFSKLLTTDLRQSYFDKLGELKEYDFSIFNINQIRADISKHMVSSVEETILKLFEDFTHRYNYSEYSKNIHMYNGWKTNKAYKINKKVIIPLNGFDSLYGGRLTFWRVRDRILDIEKVFNYLDGGMTDHVDLFEILKDAENNNQSKNIETKYFSLTFYKKGTCHILFKDEELLKKFNIFGSQSKGWIPPCYGKTAYSSMTEEEKAVVDSFEGKDSYDKTMANTKYYLFNASKALQLTNKTAS